MTTDLINAKDMVVGKTYLGTMDCPPEVAGKEFTVVAISPVTETIDGDEWDFLNVTTALGGTFTFTLYDLVSDVTA